MVASSSSSNTFELRFNSNLISNKMSTKYACLHEFKLLYYMPKTNEVHCI